ncbi:MAG: TAT-variant-translocated molybdopterin oxidoreductase [Bacteroidetes bacterium]|nr:TAT-variant-translocated molybdopterin oxidoreductase [Bacteroidota bacterium]
MIELPILDESRQSTVRQSNQGASQQKLWRSVSELRDAESLQELARLEFAPGAMDAPTESSRRTFLQLMGASMALAGLAGCRKPYEKILPYARHPEEIIEGVPMYYATAMPFRGSLLGVLVESHEGRPTKIEGNPQHPVSQGATGVFEQASVLDLYDPDRSKTVMEQGGQTTWEAFGAAVAALPASTRLAVLCEETSSPTILGMRSALAARFAQTRWVTYSGLGDNTELAGYASAFGRGVRPLYRFSQASVVVSFDADFLASTDRNFVSNTREFAASRSTENATMSRLYAVEGMYSTTGGMSDHRLRVRPSEVASVAAAVAAGVGAIPPRGGDGFASNPMVRAIVEELNGAGSRGVVLAGENQPQVVHELCAAINSRLGAIGTTVDLVDVSGTTTASDADFRRLVSDMKGGAVDVLLMVGVNPVYDAPGGFDFGGALGSVGTTIHIGTHRDETAAASTWHLPRTHYLESWGDGRAYDGTLSVIQPLIAPLYPDCRSEIEILNLIATGEQASGYDLVRRQWSGVLSGDFEAAWRRTLHDGFVPGSGFQSVSGRASAPSTQVPAASTGLEIQIRPDTRLLDGSFANNAWLQETPDLVTKIVWDNVAVMNHATAEALGVSNTLTNGQYHVDEVELTFDGRKVLIPAWILPGVADNTIVLTLGSGRTLLSDRAERKPIFFDTDAKTDVYGDGPIANGVGQRVAHLRSTSSSRILSGVTAARSGATNYPIATTQDHGAMDTPDIREVIARREPVRIAPLAKYKAHEAHFQEPPLAGATEPWESYPALWEERHPTKSDAYRDSPYFQNQWAMTIDLNLCTGCNACMLACQSENNIQVVGKDQVNRGRELHWIRIDRYFMTEHGEGDIDDAKMVVQPIPCQHCENAPCESVCPVAATVHSPDGTNQMIYNRCIGTRYCANNCPYKVRRFNFYNWTKTLPMSVQFAQNPNVTVRSRGVMEKCSYCIQRIRKANKQSNVENRPIREGDVKTACQQACAASAITFGDLNDPTSAISRKKQSDRRYELLAELSVKPRTSYLGRITNPNPALETEA